MRLLQPLHAMTVLHNCRFVDINLNRLFTSEEAQLAAAGGGGVEHRRVPELAAAIEQSTQHVDIHSSSAASPPFCFHFPGPETAAFAASFPVAYAIEDTSIQGTSIHWADQKVGSVSAHLHIAPMLSRVRH